MRNSNLIEELEKTKNSNTLYVSHYFLALNNGKDLIFYYNHQQYWDKCSLSEINNSVFVYLNEECAVFNNFARTQTLDENKLENRIPNKDIVSDSPKIGNLYALLGNCTISSHRYFYFYPDSPGASSFKIHVKKLSRGDVNLIFSHGYASTNTPKYIKNIFDLRCFQKKEGL